MVGAGKYKVMFRVSGARDVLFWHINSETCCGYQKYLAGAFQITHNLHFDEHYKNTTIQIQLTRYLDPSYLDPITYVELISKSRLFSLYIYCISASRMSNYFYVDTSAISSIIFSPWIYFSQFLLPRISNSDHDEGKQNVRCGAAGLSVNESHNRPLINKSIF